MLCNSVDYGNIMREQHQRVKLDLNWLVWIVSCLVLVLTICTYMDCWVKVRSMAVTLMGALKTLNCTVDMVIPGFLTGTQNSNHRLYSNRQFCVGSKQNTAHTD